MPPITSKLTPVHLSLCPFVWPWPSIPPSVIGCYCLYVHLNDQLICWSDLYIRKLCIDWSISWLINHSIYLLQWIMPFLLGFCIFLFYFVLVFAWILRMLFDTTWVYTSVSNEWRARKAPSGQWTIMSSFSVASKSGQSSSTPGLPWHLHSQNLYSTSQRWILEDASTKPQLSAAVLKFL